MKELGKHDMDEQTKKPEESKATVWMMPIGSAATVGFFSCIAGVNIGVLLSKPHIGLALALVGSAVWAVVVFLLAAVKVDVIEADMEDLNHEDLHSI